MFKDPRHLGHPQRVALRLLQSNKHRRGAFVPRIEFDLALGSKAHTWQAICRLRAAGYKIKTVPCSTGDPTTGGYALNMTKQEFRALGRIGFTVLVGT